MDSLLLSSSSSSGGTTDFQIPSFACFSLSGDSSSSTSSMNTASNNHTGKLFSWQESPRDLDLQLDPDKVLPSIKDVDSLIASELSKLSIGERERVENDVHGIGHTVNETPELLEEYLSQLELLLLERKHGTAFELAEAMDRRYTSARDFRLMFIRVDSYNVKEAADRMIRFFELKKHLFGSELLAKDIRLSDLSPDDMEALESGGMQISPCKDSAGRPIIAVMLGLRSYKTVENMQRASFYSYMIVAKGLEAQLRGIVTVAYAVGCRNFQSVQGLLRRCLPLRIACQHLTFDDPFAYGKAAVAIFMLSRLQRVRFRSHQGTHMECQYALATFGIPRNALPVDANGVLSTTFHRAWLQQRREKEAMDVVMSMSMGASPTVMSTTSNSPIVMSSVPKDKMSRAVDPRASDILFGRGKAVVEHPGNAWFRDLVDKTMLQYEACTRMEKASLAEMIVDMVKDAGGRFLKPEDEGDCWEEADDHTARKKVAHTFRNRRKFHSMRAAGGQGLGSYTRSIAKDEVLDLLL